MSETSPGFNVDYEIIPGANRIKGIVRNITKRCVFLPPSEGYPSERANRGGAPMLDAAMPEPAPGEVGGVEILDYRAKANDIIN